MASSRNAWGIDVGNRALKAIRLSRDGDGYRVDDFDVIEHETPLSQSGDNREALIAKALSEFVQRHKVGSTPVGIAVSGRQSFAKFIKLPPVEEKKLPEIVRFEAVQQIPFPLDEVEWQYQLFRKKDDPDIEVGLFAMRKELVNHHVSAYTAVGLKVAEVQMSPLAVYNGLARDGKLDGTTLIIDMGADTTDLVVADGEPGQQQVWHRSIPIGGNNFTETIVRAFKQDFAAAEKLKREASTSKYARQVFQAMRPVFADLVAEIQRSIGFYASTHRDAKIARAIAVGGTFKLPGLQKYLQQNLQMDVERLEAFAAAPPTDPRLITLYQENAGSAATAYGLAVQAMGDATITTSLLPSTIRREAMWREKTKYFVAAAALFAVGAGVALVGARIPLMAVQGNEDAKGQISAAMSQAEQLDREWSRVEGEGGGDRAVIKNIRTLKDDRGLWPQLVAHVRDALPQKGTVSVDELKKTPRETRRVAQIERLETVFLPNVGPLLEDTRRARFLTEAPAAVVATGGGGDMGGMSGSDMGASYNPPGGMPSFGGGQSGFSGGSSNLGDDVRVEDVPKELIEATKGKQGFLIRIAGITPNREATALLNETFINDLLKDRFLQAGQTPPPFFVADAFVVKQVPVRQNPTRLAQIAKSHADLQSVKGGKVSGFQGGAGGFPGANPGNFGAPGGDDLGRGNFEPMPGRTPTTPAGADDPTPYLDPLTGEDVRTDVEFSALVFVVLGAPPPAPAAPTEGTTPPAEGQQPAQP